MKRETKIVTICGLAMPKKNLHRNMIKFAQHLRFNSFYIAFRLDAASRAENKREIITSPPKAARTKLTTNQKVTKHSRSATDSKFPLWDLGKSGSSDGEKRTFELTLGPFLEHFGTIRLLKVNFGGLWI